MATRDDVLIDWKSLDFDRVIADREAIRRYNPQRFAMEQIDAIVYEDLERAVCVGYKDVRDDEFWVAGHMPGQPLMPGVVMCEAAAQLASYFTCKFDQLGSSLIGLGALDDVRFRGPVVPGDRLVLAVRRTKVRRRALIICRFQGFVNERLVTEGNIMGVPLDRI